MKGRAFKLFNHITFVMTHDKKLSILVFDKRIIEQTYLKGCACSSDNFWTLNTVWTNYKVFSIIAQGFLLFDGAYDAYILQIINVYNQKYESGAAFWPHVHRRVIIGLILAQLLLMGLFSMREAEKSSLFLVALPILTIWVHKFCKGRFESAFVRFPLQVS